MILHFDSQAALGTSIGAVLAFLNKVVETGGTVAATLNSGAILETVIISACGAATGFLVTTLLKYIKNKISKS